MLGTLRKHFRREVDLWSASTLIVAALILAPLVAVLVGATGVGPKWDHISSTVLWSYVANTLILLVSVPVLSLLMAIPTAWLVTAFDFPGRRFFEWALVMPLAIPTYVAAFVYYQVPERAIPLLVAIRGAFGPTVFMAAEAVLRYGLLSLILAAVLYPYLYLSARASFSQQRRGVIEAAQSLGKRPSAVFFSVVLPLARPALIAGLGLIVMEVINDYGAVNLFGVPTLTEGIFRTWFGLGDRSSAVRIAALTMMAVILLLWLEQSLRGRARFAEPSVSQSPVDRRKLRPGNQALAVTACMIPLTIGLLFPVYQLGVWAALTLEDVLQPGFWNLLERSFLLALATATTLTMIAVVFSYASRVHNVRWLRGISSLSTVGYAAPGAVVAVGVMVAFGAVDRFAGPLTEQLTSGTIFVGGTIFAIGFAYVVRFLAVAFHPMRAGMARICGSMDEASRTMGHRPGSTLVRVNLPLMRGTIFAVTMLVFVEILKELPLTLILRPANFDTLATTAFGLAKEGRILESSIPSLIIIMLAASGLVVLNRFMRRRSS